MNDWQWGTKDESGENGNSVKNSVCSFCSVKERWRCVDWLFIFSGLLLWPFLGFGQGSSPVIGVAPEISVQPVSVDVVLGGTALFSVEAVGSLPLTYQWRRNGADLKGETDRILEVADVGEGDLGDYSVWVGNLLGFVVSANAKLGILGQPRIVQQPSEISIAAGSALSIPVEITGAEPYSIEWRVDGIPLANHGESVFFVGEARIADAGSYTIRVENELGVATSAPIAVQVSSAPRIAIPLGETRRLPGSRVSQSPRVEGSEPFDYVWRLNGNEVRRTQHLPLGPGSPAGLYQLEVSNEFGSDSDEWLVSELPSMLKPPRWAERVFFELRTRVPIQVVADSRGASILVFDLAVSGSGVTVGGSDYDSPEGGDFVLAKIGPLGEVEWAHHIGGVGRHRFGSLAVGRDDEIYVVGHLEGQATLGGAVARPKGATPFVARWSSDGNLQWVADMPPSLVGDFAKVLGSPDGGGYLVADWVLNEFVTDFDGRTASEYFGLTTGAARVTVAAKFGANGLLEWVLPVDGESQFLKLDGATVDSEGDLLFVSSLGAPVTVGGVTIPFRPQPSFFGSAVFKVSRSGELDWYRHVVPHSTPIRGIDASESDEVRVRLGGQGGLSWSLNGVRTSPLPSYTPGAFMVDLQGELVGTGPTPIGNYTRTSIGALVDYTRSRWTSPADAPTEFFDEGWELVLTSYDKQGQSHWRRAIYADTSVGSFSFIGDFTVDVGGCTHLVGSFDRSTRFDDGVGIDVDTPTAFLARLTAPINENLPEIIEAPASLSRAEGETVSFRVRTADDDSVAFRWFRNGIAIPGANQPELVFEAVAREDQAAYRVQILDSAGYQTLPPAFLTVLAPPRFDAVTDDVLLLDGTPFSLKAEASGTEPLVYSWLKNGVVVAGATSSMLELVADGAATSGNYQCRVSNPFGEATTDPIRVGVVLVPEISAGPDSVGVLRGETATFQVVAQALGTVAYQWFRQGVPVPGATGDTLTIESAQFSDVGTYSVTVSNEAGSVESERVSLAVDGLPPVVEEFPGPIVEALEGDPVFLSVTASGDPTLRYEWFRDDLPAPVGTSKTLVFDSIRHDDAGTYRVRISSSHGATVSDDVVLRVLFRSVTPPEIEPLVQFEASEQIHASSVLVADDGHVLVAGSSRGDARFGAESLFQSEMEQGFLSCIASNGDVSWTLNLDSTGGSFIDDVAVSLDGSRYLVGGGTGALNLGEQLLDSEGFGLLFAKLGLGGEVVWARRASFSGANPLRNHIVATASGSIVASSIPAGVLDLQIEDSQLSAPESDFASLVLIGLGNQAGALQWIHHFAGSNEIQLTTLEPDGFGGTYLAGVFSGQLELGSFTLDSAGGLDGFLARIDDRGEVLSALRWGGASDERVSGMSTDVRGQVYLSGIWSDSWTLGTLETQLDTSQGHPIIRLRPDGQLDRLLPSRGGLWGRPDAFGNMVTIRRDDNLLESEVALVPDSDGLSALRLRRVDATGEVLWQSSILGEDLQVGSNDRLSVGLLGETVMAVHTPRLLVPGADVGGNDSNVQRVSVLRLKPSSDPFLPTVPNVFARSTVDWGDSFSVEADARGIGELEYLWLLDGRVLPGQTTASFTVRSARLADGGMYQALVGNSFGASLSAPAEVTIRASAPTIQRHPLSMEVDAGSRVQFEVEAAPGPSVEYQWFFRGQPIPGATDSVWVIEQATFDDVGSFRAVVSNMAGSTQSNTARLRVRERPPVIATQPAAASLEIEAAFRLFVVVEGDETVTYEWYRNEQLLPDETDWFIRRDSFAVEDAGVYYVVVTGIGGSTESLRAEVLVDVTPPMIHLSLEQETLLVGESAVITATIEGPDDYQLQWFHGGETIQGGGGPILSIENVSLSTAGEYRLVVRDSAGNDFEASVELRVVSLPIITPEPNEPYQYVGRPVLLRAGFDGEIEGTFQWRLNGEEIDGATGRAWPILSPGRGDAGEYTFVAQFGDRAVAAAPLSLEFFGAPEIIEAPTDVFLREGDSHVLELVLNRPEDSVDIRWNRDGRPLVGQGGASLRFESVTVADAGLYGVDVSNPAGTASIENVRVEVIPIANLRLGRSGSLLLLIWTDEDDRFVIEESSWLGDETSWSVNTQTPIKLGAERTLPIAPTGESKFFRLNLREAADGP